MLLGYKTLVPCCRRTAVTWADAALAVHPGAAGARCAGCAWRAFVRMRRVGGCGRRVPGDASRRAGRQVGQAEEQAEHELRQAQVGRRRGLKATQSAQSLSVCYICP